MNVGVGIDPQHVQISVELDTRQNWRARHWMISPDTEERASFAQASAHIENLSVAVLRAELGVLDDVRAVSADFPEDLVVHGKTAFIHSTS